MRIRLMRGQVVVREIDATPSPVLWMPDPRARDVSTHRGVVLGMGPPARLTESPNSPEVPHGFEVGAVVQYHFAAMGTQEARTRAWTDGGAATWLVQAEIDAVWEEDTEKNLAEDQERDRAFHAAGFLGQRYEMPRMLR